MKQLIKRHWHDNKQLVALVSTALLFVAIAVQYAFGLTYVVPALPIVFAIITAVTLLFWDLSPKRKAVLASGAILFGFMIEFIGLKTGILFGNVTFGTVMGYRLAGVPFTIGILWFLVTLSAWHIVNIDKRPVWQRFLLGGVLVVMFDLVLEQFAITYGLWSWQGSKIPLTNYVTWFLMAQLFLLGYYVLDKKRIASLYIAGLLPLMALFFWIMSLIYG